MVRAIAHPVAVVTSRCGDCSEGTSDTDSEPWIMIMVHGGYDS